MFTIDRSSSQEIQQYVDSCLQKSLGACLDELGMDQEAIEACPATDFVSASASSPDSSPTPSQAPCSAQGGALHEKFGIFITLFVGTKPVYATGVLLPEGPLHASIAMLCSKAVQSLRKNGAFATKEHINAFLANYRSRIKITSEPDLCVKVDYLDLQRYGLILFTRGRSHYLLPGEALKHNLSQIGALEYLCHYMALPAGTWRDRRARVMTFEAFDIA